MMTGIALGSVNTTLARGAARISGPRVVADAFAAPPADSDGRTVVIEGATIQKFPDLKDPEDLTDFTFDVSSLLSTDDQVSSVIRVDVTPDNALPQAATTYQDLVVNASLGSGPRIILWLSEGQPGWRYHISVMFWTRDGRRLQRSAYLTVNQL